MTDDATRSQRLLAPLRERPHSVDAARSESRRARVVPELQRHLAALGAKRRRVRRMRGVLAAVAAVVIAAVVFRVGTSHRQLAPKVAEIRAVEGHLVHSVSGLDHTVLAGDRLVLPVDGELRTDATSGASLETEAGLRMDLDVSSEVSLSQMADKGEHRVELRGGQIACAVPKLEPGTTFAVVTPNARVVVHGTKFTVRVDSSEAGVTRTCVRVREGLVAVHHASGRAMLHAGESWGCPEAPATAVPAPAYVEAPRLATRTTVRAGRAGRAEHVVAAPAPREGTLAQETELLQSALAAERSGRRDAAMTSLTRLLSTYPDSPLLPEARAALKRVAVASAQAP
ncbi:MAG TPA: FecR domain-containing protein [Polyangiaceae bacterium]|jgi:ferric-dicitrate binding protein FerR (iron transport regulator)|nr:FecR domain-containing protein [Polyangiaceae bacterium]